MSAVISAAVRSWEVEGRVTRLLRQRLGVPNVFLVSSGRAALTLILRSLQRLSRRQEVIIPAYTCFSVPSAVARSGLTIRLCDVDPKTLDLDHAALLRLDLSRALCIVPSGLYGMPANLVALEQISQAAGAFLVDDAAQCLGAAVNRKACGAFGDAGFYSFGRGKNLTAMGGGVLVTHREDVARTIRQEMVQVPRASGREMCAAILSSLVYALMLEPSRYWVVDRIPFLGLGVSRFDPDFRITRLSTYQQWLVMELLPYLDAYNRLRRETAAELRGGIDGIEGIEIPEPADGAHPVHLRLPILARDERHRRQLLVRLRAAAVGASPSYPSSVGDIPGIEPYLACDLQACPQARSIASRIITLPTHPYVTAADIDRIISIIRDPDAP